MAFTTTLPQLDPRSSAVAADKGRDATSRTAVATMSERDRYLAEDAQAWRSVCGVLIAVVAAGALSMAIVVAAIVLTS